MRGSRQTTATVSAASTASQSKVVNSVGGKKAGANVKPLSTQERMSMFMEHTITGSSKLTPRVVIRNDAKFKAACNRIRWLNKDSEAVMAKATATSAGNGKDSKTSGGQEEKTSGENESQFYSFYEKPDPSLDESVNPPIKLPSALLVRELSLLQ